MGALKASLEKRGAAKPSDAEERKEAVGETKVSKAPRRAAHHREPKRAGGKK